MHILVMVSNMVIPAVVFSIVLMGILDKQDVYSDFIKGAQEGFQTVIKIMPTLVGLMMGVGILRASGFLDMLAELAAPFVVRIGFPAELLTLAIVKLFSSSAATGVVIDIFKEYGPDSYTGMIASIMMSCTETIFYTMSVYFLAAKVTKTRWTLVGALLSTLAGVAASVLIVNFF